MEILKYTTILHPARIKLGLSYDEYCIADAIKQLSTKTSKTPGWCHAGKDYLAKVLGITRKTVHKWLARLIEKGIVERNPDDRALLRTTDIWFNTVTLEREKMTTDYKQKNNLIKTK